MTGKQFRYRLFWILGALGAYLAIYVVIDFAKDTLFVRHSIYYLTMGSGIVFVGKGVGIHTSNRVDILGWFLWTTFGLILILGGLSFLLDSLLGVH